LISPNWDVEFHVHTNASLLAINAMLTKNNNRKTWLAFVYVFKLLNSAKKNYSTTKCKTLAMVFALHKFKHYLLDNKFGFLCRAYGFGLSNKQTTCLRTYYQIIATLALGSWPRQGLAKVWAKNEARESHFMLMRV